MNRFKKLLSLPLFWTNVVTAVVMFVLVASIVFGWTNPVLPPPQGSGAIGIDANEDVTFSTKVVVDPGARRQLKNVGAPTHNNDLTTKTWVETYVNGLLGQQSGSAGRLLVTLWGSCTNGSEPGCPPGEGAPECSVLGSQTEVKEVYEGYGPLQYTELNLSNDVAALDSILICIKGTSPGGGYGYPYLGPAGTIPFAPYVAAWDSDPGAPPGVTAANTCRVCLMEPTYVPLGGP